MSEPGELVQGREICATSRDGGGEKWLTGMRAEDRAVIKDWLCGVRK